MIRAGPAAVGHRHHCARFSFCTSLPPPLSSGPTVQSALLPLSLSQHSRGPFLNLASQRGSEKRHHPIASLAARVLSSLPQLLLPGRGPRRRKRPREGWPPPRSSRSSRRCAPLGRRERQRRSSRRRRGRGRERRRWRWRVGMCVRGVRGREVRPEGRRRRRRRRRVGEGCAQRGVRRRRAGRGEGRAWRGGVLRVRVRVRVRVRQGWVRGGVREGMRRRRGRRRGREGGRLGPVGGRAGRDGRDGRLRRGREGREAVRRGRVCGRVGERERSGGVGVRVRLRR